MNDVKSCFLGKISKILKNWNSGFELALDEENHEANLMFVKPDELLGNIQIANVFHHPILIPILIFIFSTRILSIYYLRKSIRATYTFISVDKYLEISTYYLEIST